MTLRKFYIRKILGLILLIFAGVFMFVYGEYDDSPGGQLLGLLLFIIGIVGLTRSRKNFFN